MMKRNASDDDSGGADRKPHATKRKHRADAESVGIGKKKKRKRRKAWEIKKKPPGMVSLSQITNPKEGIVSNMYTVLSL
jgi:hypothetical protein